MPFFLAIIILYLTLRFDSSSWYSLAFVDFGGLHSINFSQFLDVYKQETVIKNIEAYLASFLYSIISIYLFTVIIIFFFLSKFSTFIFALFLSGIVSFLYSLVLNHPGNSDLYFLGNTFLINIVICQILIRGKYA